MTFDREPDLDNANVGMPCRNRRFMRKLTGRELPFLLHKTGKRMDACMQIHLKKERILLKRFAQHFHKHYRAFIFRPVKRRLL